MWIDEYRDAHGIELDEFARMVNRVGRQMNPPLIGCVSDTLIYLLEVSPTPRTHPRIADAIAYVCGATDEQRDSIVDKTHKGTRSEIVIKPKRQKRDTMKSVLRIDRNGQVVGRYDSVNAAGAVSGMSRDAVLARCMRRMKDDFSRYEFTFRFEKEWSAMSESEKMADIGGK